jgi:hypothetical protein
MNRLRAEDIERKVIYKALNFMPYDTIDPMSAFHVGRMMGIIQETLNRELGEEVKKELSKIDESEE